MRNLHINYREYNVITQTGFQGMSEVLELFAKLPTPEEILALKPSEALQFQIQHLLEKSRSKEGLTPEEEQQWQQYEYLEHLMRIAKTSALLKLKHS